MRYICTHYCPNCDEYFKSIRGSIPPCPNCGGERQAKMVEKYSENDPNIRTEFVNWDGMNKENIRVSRSLSVPKGQFKEAQKMHPGVEFKDLGNGYIAPVIHNRAEKLKVMKEAGYVEFPDTYFQQRHDKGLAR